MKNHTKLTKMLSLVLAMVMLSTASPLSIFAEGSETESDNEDLKEVVTEVEDAPDAKTEENEELPALLAAEPKGVIYTVLFDNNDGINYSYGELTQVKVPAGEAITSFPKNPSYPSGEYEFLGWATASDYQNFSNLEDYIWNADTPVEYNITLYAVWGNCVAFDPNDGNTYNLSEMEKAYTLTGQPVAAPTASPKNPLKTFLGWSYAANYEDFENLDDYLWDFNEPITRNTTLYGVWGYNVLFDPNDGGNYTYDQLYKLNAMENKPVTKPANPTRAGYVFKGWAVAADYENFANLNDYLWDFNTGLEYNLTLYAVWARDNTSTGTGGGGNDNFDWNEYFKKETIGEDQVPAAPPEIVEEPAVLPTTGSNGAGSLFYTFAATFLALDFKNSAKRRKK